jgi:hypothetical protein
LDLRGNIPSFIHMRDGKGHDVNLLDHLPPKSGAFHVMDRCYLDFARLYRFHPAVSFSIPAPSPISMRSAATRIPKNEALV